MLNELGLSSFELLSSSVPAFHYKSGAEAIAQNRHRVFHFNRAAFEKSYKYHHIFALIMEPEKRFNKMLGGNDFYTMIYHEKDSDPNIEIYKWLRINVNSLFNSGLLNFKNKEPQLYFVQSYNINGYYNDDNDYCYIGLTEGLINYSAFFFKNIFRDQNFLIDIIEKENQNDQPIIIKYVQFENWIKFSVENDLLDANFNVYKPKNPVRAVLSDIFIAYFLLFAFMHEVAHLNQDRKKLEELKRLCSNEEDKNLIQQIKEMDADNYAVNRLLEHVFNIFHDKEHTINREYPFFYRNEKHLARYTLLIIFTMFYMFWHNKKFGRDTLKEAHPHPSLRFKYASQLMLNNSVGNNLLGIDNWQNCIKTSIKDFGDIINMVFPNDGIYKFYTSIKEEESSEHYKFLLNEARKYNGLLNGNYE